MKPVLSVIIPIYKAEKFLERCVDSILIQDYQDFEIILVEDGTPDRSGEICDRYASKDQRIKVIHQENNGVSAARNAGLDIAGGKYVSFIDADDAIAPGMYSAMVAKAEETSAEIVGCGVQYYSEQGVYKRSDLLQEMDLGREEMLSALFDCPDPLGGSCCNKIFLMSAVRELRYEKNVAMGEDWLFLFASFEKTNRLYKMPQPFYCVTEHPNSSARKRDVSVPRMILETSKKMMMLAKGHSYELGCKAVRKYLDDSIRYVRQIRSIGEEMHVPFRRLIMRCKCGMLKELISAFLKKQLSRNEMHGFLYGMIKA